MDVGSVEDLEPAGSEDASQQAQRDNSLSGGAGSGAALDNERKSTASNDSGTSRMRQPIGHDNEQLATEPFDVRHRLQNSQPSQDVDSKDVRPGGVFHLLNAKNAHEGNIEELDRFDLAFPDAGRPTHGREKRKDDVSTSLIKKRNSYLLPKDLVLARVEYDQGGEAARQPVSLFKIVKIFRDRHKHATWMSVRWYGQEQDVFLGKYYEKKEKLGKQDLAAMEKLRRQGKDPSLDVRFMITPDENLFLCAADGSNFVQGRKFNPPLFVHWGKKIEILTKETSKIRDTVVRLITTDVRLLNLPGLDIVKAVEEARSTKRRRSNAVKKKAPHVSPSSSSESSSSSGEDDDSSSSEEELMLTKSKKRKL